MVIVIIKGCNREYVVRVVIAAVVAALKMRA